MMIYEVNYFSEHGVMSETDKGKVKYIPHASKEQVKTTN